MATMDQAVARLQVSRTGYQREGDGFGIPWAFVAVTQNMESSLDFPRHLHNGDPLTSRTVQVPASRPKTGAPRFICEESASDALTMKKLGAGTDLSLAGMLYQPL